VLTGLKSNIRRNLVIIGLGASVAVALTVWLGYQRSGSLEVNSGIPFSWNAYEPGRVVGSLSWGVAGTKVIGILTTTELTRTGEIISPASSWFSGTDFDGRFQISIGPSGAAGSGIQDLHEIRLRLVHYPGGNLTLVFHPGSASSYNHDHQVLLALQKRR